MARSAKVKDRSDHGPAPLGSLVKSARDIMRKDKGLNGDLDRLPMLTWIMFLKFLDDMERDRANRGEVSAGSRYQPVIEPPYRWRDWAASEDGITGDELIAFINQDEAVRPGRRARARASSPTCGRCESAQRRRPPRRHRDRLPAAPSTG